LSLFLLCTDRKAVSMIDGKLLDKLEEMGRLIRGKSEPFGGIQLVLSGDFAQLPPVPDRDTKTGKQMEVAFAFEAKSWGRCIERQVVLKKVFRQRNQGTLLSPYRLMHRLI
jgi:ATP-dependent DNA helicase PIF1